MLYRSYIRADELTVLDYKETKLFYLQYMPQALLTREGRFVAAVHHGLVKRRRNGIRSFGGGNRAIVTDLCITPLHATHRKSFAKEQLRNIKIWPLMVAEMAQDIVKSIKHRILFIENVIRFGGVTTIVKEFIKENKSGSMDD
ncbi:hypothetical protein COOONC_01899 [Cooperia oncophora]